MRKRNFALLLLVVLSCGLIAAGCGDDSSDTSTTATEATSTEATTSEDTTSEDTSTTEETTSDDTSSDTGLDTSPEDIYNACQDLIEGTPAEQTAQAGCEQARDAFQQCADQANAISDSATKEQALGICQKAADKAIDTLESAAG